jgi:pilus assembly protein Flp/PilA
MAKLLKWLSSSHSAFIGFADDTSGATAIEYSLMAGLIAMAIIGTVFTVGNDIKVVLYDRIAAALAGG